MSVIKKRGWKFPGIRVRAEYGADKRRYVWADAANQNLDNVPPARLRKN